MPPAFSLFFRRVGTAHLFLRLLVAGSVRPKKLRFQVGKVGNKMSVNVAKAIFC